MAFRSNGPITVALPPFRGVTRQILLTALVVYFAVLVLNLFSPSTGSIIASLLELQPMHAIHKLLWQFLTYPFVADGLLGLVFAALSVWFFGSALEEELGGRWMLEFFLACTVGGGLLASVVTFVLDARVEGLGAYAMGGSLWPFSLALLIVFATLHADQELNFNFILRVKAKYIAAIYLLVYLAVALSAHQRFDAVLVLANALCGWLFLRVAPRRGVRFAVAEGMYGLQNSVARAKRRRAAKKFTVYMQRQGREVKFDESGRYLDPDAERRNGHDPNDRKWMN